MLSPMPRFPSMPWSRRPMPYGDSLESPTKIWVTQSTFMMIPQAREPGRISSILVYRSITPTSTGALHGVPVSSTETTAKRTVTATVSPGRYKKLNISGGTLGHIS